MSTTINISQNSGRFNSQMNAMRASNPGLTISIGSNDGAQHAHGKGCCKKKKDKDDNFGPIGGLLRGFGNLIGKVADIFRWDDDDDDKSCKDRCDHQHPWNAYGPVFSMPPSGPMMASSVFCNNGRFGM